MTTTQSKQDIGARIANIETRIADIFDRLTQTLNASALCAPAPVEMDSAPASKTTTVSYVQ